jgi:anti-sigma regulatory factor (Ser/Thr protein kinase)
MRGVPAVTDIGHGVQFYRDEAELCYTVGTFVADGIRDGGASIVVATEPHRRSFDDALATAGIDPDAARNDGSLLNVDAATMLASITKDGRLDRAAFDARAATIVRRAAKTHRSVRVYGEMVSMLWDAGDVIGAIELETLCNELRRELRVTMLCAYHRETLSDDSHADALSAVCRLHSAVLGHFPNDITAPGDARRLVADALLRWGHEQELSEAAALVVSELASNAVRHARSPFSVLTRFDQHVIRIWVRDASDTMPQLREGGLAAGTGMGLQMVAALAGAWGVEVRAGGKSVWAQLALGPGRRPAR